MSKWRYKVYKKGKVVAETTTKAEARKEASKVGGTWRSVVKKRNPVALTGEVYQAPTGNWFFQVGRYVKIKGSKHPGWKVEFTREYETKREAQQARMEWESKKRNPVRKVKGGYQWGSSGKVYKRKTDADKQARAIYASGWREKNPTDDIEALFAEAEELSLEEIESLFAGAEEIDLDEITVVETVKPLTIEQSADALKDAVERLAGLQAASPMKKDEMGMNNADYPVGLALVTHWDEVINSPDMLAGVSQMMLKYTGQMDKAENQAVQVLIRRGPGGATASEKRMRTKIAAKKDEIKKEEKKRAKETIKVTIPGDFRINLKMPKVPYTESYKWTSEVLRPLISASAGKWVRDTKSFILVKTRSDVWKRLVKKTKEFGWFFDIEGDIKKGLVEIPKEAEGYDHYVQANVYTLDELPLIPQPYGRPAVNYFKDRNKALLNEKAPQDRAKAFRQVIEFRILPIEIKDVLKDSLPYRNWEFSREPSITNLPTTWYAFDPPKSNWKKFKKALKEKKVYFDLRGEEKLKYWPFDADAGDTAPLDIRRAGANVLINVPWQLDDKSWEISNAIKRLPTGRYVNADNKTNTPGHLAIGYSKWGAVIEPLSNIKGIDMKNIKALFSQLLAEEKERLALIEQAKNLKIKLAPGMKPMSWQPEGIRFLAGRTQAILGDDMGMGKTLQSIVAADNVVPKDQPILCVVPATKGLDWRKEIIKFTVSGDKNPNCVKILKTKPVKKRTYETNTLDKNCRWFIVSLALGRRPSPLRTLLWGQKWGAVIVDESHAINNPDAQQSRFVAKLKSHYLWLLTGTPVTNRPMGLFGALALLKHPLGADKIEFGMRFACGHPDGGYNEKSGRDEPECKTFGRWDWSGATNQDELKERTAGVLLWRNRDDYQDLPDQQALERMVEVPHDLEVWVPSDALTPARILAEMTEKRVALAVAKADASFEAAIEAVDNGHKVLMFTNFTNFVIPKWEKLADEYKAKCDSDKEDPGYCPFEYRVYRSGDSDTKKDKILTEFKTDPNIKILMGNLQSMGTGLNLQSATYSVFNDLDWSPYKHEQAEARTRRTGQTKKTFVMYVTAEAAMDVALQTLLAQKMAVIRNLQQGRADADASSEIDREAMIREMEKYVAKRRNPGRPGIGGWYG